MEQTLTTYSTVKVNESEDLYKLVDCLNRTLKDDQLVFGLAKDQEEEGKMVFTIYKA